ncbi:cytochrome P450 2K4-like [Pelodytes ibericus]
MTLTFSTTAWVLLVLTVLYVVYILKSWTQRSDKRSPPGPRPLPLIGNLHMINLRRPTDALMKFSKQYGNIYSIQMGNIKAVVLSGYETVKSALVDYADEFSGRPFIRAFEDINKGYGIPFSHGENWRQMRRFTLSTLRDFGMGKKTIEDKIVEEYGFLIKELELENGKPTDLSVIVNIAVGNLITSIVLGHRYDYNDPTLRRLMELVNENMRLLGSPSVLLYNMFTIFGYFPGEHLKVKKNIDELHEFLRNTFFKHLKDLDRDDQRSFIDVFLVKQQQEEANPDSYYHESNLLSVITTLFTAGTETTASTIRWAISFMVQHPDIQKRVHEEIDQVIGSSLPKFEHRINMPYTNAVIHETQRFANIVPMNIPRETTKDVMFKGYYLPKGTYVIPLLESVLYDQTQFDKPDSFCPEHFLDEGGRFVRSAAFMPFSAGKRACIGETLAVMELFLFFTRLMQRFTFHPAPGVNNFNVKPAVGFTVPPITQMMILKPRS